MLFRNKNNADPIIRDHFISRVQRHRKSNSIWFFHRILSNVSCQSVTWLLHFYLEVTEKKLLKKKPLDACRP